MNERTIQDLFLDGIELRLWETTEQCAKTLGFNPAKLRRWMKGSGNTKDMGEARTSLISRIDQAREGGNPPPVMPILHLYVDGLRRGLWVNQSTCADAVDVYRSTLRKYMDRQKTDCQGREQTQWQSLWQSLHDALQRKTQAKKKSGATKAPESVDSESPPVPPPQADAHWMDAFIDELARRVADRLHGTSSPGIPAGPSIASSDWIDQVVAGHRELVGQSTPGCRFVIATADTIVPIVRGLTADERSDTAKLIGILTVGVTELRRRLTLSAQTADVSAREQDLEVLGAELDLLVVGIEQAGDANLGASAASRQAQRNELAQLRNALKGERKQTP